MQHATQTSPTSSWTEVQPINTRRQVCTRPYPTLVTEPRPKDSAADQASAAQYTPQQEVRPSTFPTAATPTPEYGGNPPSARSANFPPEYLSRQQHFAQQQSHHASAGSMAQATSPSMSLSDGHPNNHHTTPHMKSNTEVPIDPSIAASSPTYPGPYSPYGPPGHDMSQYQGHPQQQMYGRPDWPQQYPGHPHGLPGPYSSPGTAVSSGSSAATAGPRPGQVCHHRPS